MKILCDVCEKTPATLICCADEAALCADCDTRIHAANKLANKHQRVRLISPSPGSSVSCDICQEKPGYFFCLEDRALLCRNCDVSIHSSNALTSNHRRFLVTGLRVALQAVSTHDVPPVETPSPRQGTPQTGSPSPSQSLVQMNGLGGEPQMDTSTLAPNSTIQQVSGLAMASAKVKPVSLLSPSTTSLNLTPVPSVSSIRISPSVGTESKSVGMKKGTDFPNLNGVGVGGGGRKGNISEYLTEAIPEWGMDEFLTFPDMASGYNFADIGSSKGDASNLWDLDWHSDLSLFEEQAFGRSFAEVPQMPSPPTASGLWRSGRVIGTTKAKLRPELAVLTGYNDFSRVPDLGAEPSPKLSPPSPPLQKRRRTFMEF